MFPDLAITLPNPARVPEMAFTRTYRPLKINRFSLTLVHSHRTLKTEKGAKCVTDFTYNILIHIGFILGIFVMYTTIS